MDRKTDKPSKKIAEVNEFAMIFILDVDHTPTILPSANRFALDNDVPLRPYDGERNNIL